MMVLIKTPVTCVILILYMIGFYYRKPHIPIRSTRIFQRFINVVLLNAVFDLITICTVNCRDAVPDILNLVAHIIYLLSISGVIYFLFLYMRSYLETELKLSPAVRAAQDLPFAIFAVGILVLPITYVSGRTTDYSLGPKAYALYCGLVVYLFLILYYCLRYWKLMDNEKKVSILLAVPIFVIISLIQMIFPETLLVVAGSTLILLGLILSNENTEKYMDEQTKLFNQYSMERVLEEFNCEKQKLIIAVLCFCKTENNMDWGRDVQVLNDVHKLLRQYRLYGYRVCENGVAFLSSTEEKAGTVLAEVEKAVKAGYGRSAVKVETKIFAEGAAGARCNGVRDIVSFCTDAGSQIAYIDRMTNIYNRNALERDLEKAQGNQELSYVIADLNNLKVVNDTIGHSAGDRLLQGFAKLLSEAAGDDGRVYRQGGDEFAILYSKDARHLMQKLEERCRVYNQSCTISLSYAIGYCPLSEEGFRDIADQMMYDDKKRKKGHRQTKNMS